MALKDSYYPLLIKNGTALDKRAESGINKHEKLAMGIYTKMVSIYTNEGEIANCAKRSIEAAKIFFDELDKYNNK